MSIIQAFILFMLSGTSNRSQCLIDTGAIVGTLGQTNNKVYHALDFVLLVRCCSEPEPEVGRCIATYLAGNGFSLSGPLEAERINLI